jgi:ABC-2 type transport system permease protein
MSVMTFLIWHSKLSNLTDLLYEGHNVSKYPQEIYKGASEFIFFALFPLTLVVVIPAKALIHKLVFTDIIWPFFFAVVMFFIARKFWKFALRSYTSASG